MLKKIILVPVAFVVVGLALSIGYYFFFPDVSALKRVNPAKTSFMEYREDQWQKEGKKKKVQQRWVPLSNISPFVVKAVIIAEDDKFWRHEGFDYQAMQKALEKDIKKKTFKAGGSTISQQLAKNLYLSPSKNPVRKIKEAVLTWRIERALSKKRIIELYLNIAEWGDGIFGIELAAQRYFGKPASALTALEGAKLAAVLPNPLKFNPIGDSKYVAARSDRIYQIMIRRGMVIPEYEELMQEKDDETVVGLGAEGAKKLEEKIKNWKKEEQEAAEKVEKKEGLPPVPPKESAGESASPKP